MIKVTDKHVHDSKPLPRMVDNIIKLDNVTVAIGKLFATMVLMKVMASLDMYRTIEFYLIKIRKNAQVRLKKGHRLRNLSVVFQKKI